MVDPGAAILDLLDAFGSLPIPPAEGETLRHVMQRLPAGSLAHRIADRPWACLGCTRTGALRELHFDPDTGAVACPRCGAADRAVRMLQTSRRTAP